MGLGLGLALALAGGLSGCVSLLPKQTPVQLYRFGVPPAAAPARDVAVGRGEATLGVILSEVTLPRAALGDGVLTVKGDQAAYVAGARWLSPAVILFRDAAETAFQGRAGRVRLLDRGELGAASALLRLDVSEFDIRYDPQGVAPPAVAVRLIATLTRADGRRLLQHGFEVVRPAAADRMGDIVAAYDAATASILAQAADWTEAAAPEVAADLPADAPTQPLPPHAVRLPPTR
jgi:cholesterol transport system auxiliary component